MHKRGLLAVAHIPSTGSLATSSSSCLRRQMSSFGLKTSRTVRTEDERPMHQIPERMAKAAGSADSWTGWKRTTDSPMPAEQRIRDGARSSSRRKARVAEPSFDEFAASTSRGSGPSTRIQPVITGEEMEARELPGLSDAFGVDDVKVGTEEWLPQGTYVEIRRNGRVSIGVALHEVIVNGRLLVSTLTRAGSKWQHARVDVLYALPGFIDADLARRCGTGDMAEGPKETQARVDVIRKITNVERGLENVFNAIARHMPDVYDKVKSSNPDEWATVSLKQVVDMIDYKAPLAIMKEIAVHRHLMRRSDQFYAEPLSYRVSRKFRVRPQSHIDVLQGVQQMIRERSPVLQSFTDKARALLASNQQHEEQAWNSSPQATPNKADITFTDEEQTILRFIKVAYHKRKWIQVDPYALPLATLVRPLLQDHSMVDDFFLHKLVTGLGLLPPWENLGAREYEDSMRIPRRDPALETKLETLLPRFEEQIATLQTTTTVTPMTPEDLYLGDPHEVIRHDFGDLPVYVLDDPGAEELDDGISIEAVPNEPGSRWVHVHIADPTAILPPSHYLAKRAQKMGQSQYLIDGTISMLPKDLVTKHMSLGSQGAHGRPENVLTFSAKVNSRGELVDHKVRAGRVRNVQLLNYDDFNAVLGPVPGSRYPLGGGPTEPYKARPLTEKAVSDLKMLLATSDALVEFRKRLPVFMSLNFEAEIVPTTHSLPETQTDLSRPMTYTGFPSLAYRVSDLNIMGRGARLMVAELMILANRVASRFCAERRIPAVRRGGTQALTPSDEIFQTLLDSRNDLGHVDYYEAAKLGAVFPPGGYSIEPVEHWSLGVPHGEGYLRATSPLRRYEDLLAHWQIKHALMTEHTKGKAGPLFSAERCRTIMNSLAFQAALSKQASVLERRHWIVSYLHRHINDPNRSKADDPVDFNNLEGVIAAAPNVDVVNGGTNTRVWIPQLAAVTSLVNIRSPDAVAVGDHVRMRLKALEIGFNPRIVTVQNS